MPEAEPREYSGFPVSGKPAKARAVMDWTKTISAKAGGAHIGAADLTADLARRYAPDLLLLALYGLAFAALHWAAHPWGGGGFFSLWYPAAGLRFAALWRRGLAITPWLMATELCVDAMTGALPLTGSGVIHDSISIMRPALAYAAAIAIARSMAGRLSGHRGESGSEPVTAAPMRLGIAALLAPVLNALMFVPLELALPPTAGPSAIRVQLVVSLTGLALGDLLGIIVLAPPLLSLARFYRSAERRALTMPGWRLLVPGAVILGASMWLTVALWRAGLGAQPTPLLLAGAWIGLRHGRTAAWFTILAVVALFLPYSAGPLGDGERLNLHLSLAAVAIVTWLSGCYADTQKIAEDMLARRNRLLFQAERLKTLRAMSVAVIHEISQPLSTLAIEAGHLKSRTADLDADIAQSAALVDRKAHTLSELVRRLRRFGGRSVDEPSPLPLCMLLQSSVQMVAPELRSAQCQLVLAPVPPDLTVHAQEIELSQALVNLLRNAITAAADRTVRMSTQMRGDDAVIRITNAVSARSAPPSASGAGMGIGVIIARTIVEAHGGMLVRDDEPGFVHMVVSLPLHSPRSGTET